MAAENSQKRIRGNKEQADRQVRRNLGVRFLHPAFYMSVLGFMLLVWNGCGPSATKPNVGGKSEETSSSGSIRLVDRAESAGIRFRLGHGGRTPLTILDTAGCGCAFVDVDGDGLLDIVLVGQPRCALYRNRGDGTFEDITKQAGLAAAGTWMGVAVGDYDNDGRPDLLITGYGKNALYHNVGGRFVDVTALAGLAAHSPYDWATSAVFADFDGDGKLDLAIGHYVTFTPTTLQTCRYGTTLAACPPFYYEPQHLQMWRGDGRGHFTDCTQAWGLGKGHGNNLGLAVCDFNGDGKPDLYVANDGLPGDLWLNTGHGFRNVGSVSGTATNQEGHEQAGMGVDWGDYDNDGKMDLLVTTFQEEPTSLYHNEGGELFTYASFTAGIADATRRRVGFGVAFVDLDGDGWLDVLCANGHVQDNVAQFRPPATYAQTLQCFHNTNGTAGHANRAETKTTGAAKGTETRRFQDVSASCGPEFARPIVGRGLTIGDYDNDGRPDALVIDLEGKPLLLHNESPAHSWVGARLIGTRSNRDAIGACLVLNAGGSKQVREVQTGRGYLSASDPRILFGLGTYAGLVTITVRWPSGQVTKEMPIRLNCYTEIREDTS